MREFNKTDFPPFLYIHDADHENCVGVETTLAELTTLGYSLVPCVSEPVSPGRFPGPELLRTHGNRRVFAIINFPRRYVENTTYVFIEVQDDQDAEILQQSLQDQLATSVNVEKLDPTYGGFLDLDGYRWYRFDSI